jgi:metal-sulfur cluster biosynthetic enzyme
MTEPEQTPPPETPAADAVRVEWTPDQVREVLRGVFDPELHMNIVDLGLIYDAQVKDDVVDVKMTLTSPGCPYGPYLIHQVKDTLMTLKGIRDVKLEVVWDPPWGPDRMTEEARLELGFDL